MITTEQKKAAIILYCIQEEGYTLEDMTILFDTGVKQLIALIARSGIEIDVTEELIHVSTYQPTEEEKQA